MSRLKLTVRTSGHVVTSYDDGRPDTYEETVQCSHCQRHRRMPIDKNGRVGKGWDKLWHFCYLCGNLVCAGHCALQCVPAEQWLENVEKGLPELHRDVKVAVPAGLPE
jgi:hypothetical protein